MQAIQSYAISLSRVSALALGVFLAVGVPRAQAGSIDPELASQLKRESAAQRYPVVIRLANQANLAELSARVAGLPQAQRGGRLLEALDGFAKAQQAPLLQELKKRGAERVTPLVTVNAIAADLTARDIRELALRTDVGTLRYDIGLLAPTRQAMADPCHPARPTPRARLPKSCNSTTQVAAAPVGSPAAFDIQVPASASIAPLGVAEAWQAGFTGKGVTVAVIDTGVDTRQQDLAGSFRAGPGDWFDVHNEQPRPVDRHGHGTQITGLVVGASGSGQTLGVAPQAKWIAARVYNNRNIGRLSDLHRVMAWVLDPDGKPATPDTPQIALNAWGLGDRIGSCDTEFASDIAWLRAAGVHVVFAAGNGGPSENTSVSPANNPGALSVGALDASGQLASFSSRGPSACDRKPYPEVTAPGEGLRTTDLSAGVMSAYTLGTGSSFAAAVVAGELALLVQARPGVSMVERESLLRTVPGDNRPALLRALGLSVSAAAPKTSGIASIGATEQVSR
jgi:subtilisin family serine protease